jgi:hypothetical protein
MAVPFVPFRFPMAAVSEQMKQYAREQQQVWQCPEQMGAVLGEEKEGRDRQKTQQRQAAAGSYPIIPGRSSFIVHRLPPFTSKSSL